MPHHIAAFAAQGTSKDVQMNMSLLSATRTMLSDNAILLLPVTLCIICGSYQACTPPKCAKLYHHALLVSTLTWLGAGRLVEHHTDIWLLMQHLRLARSATQAYSCPAL